MTCFSLSALIGLLTFIEHCPIVSVTTDYMHDTFGGKGWWIGRGGCSEGCLKWVVVSPPLPPPPPPEHFNHTLCESFMRNLYENDSNQLAKSKVSYLEPEKKRETSAWQQRSIVCSKLEIVFGSR